MVAWLSSEGLWVRMKLKLKSEAKEAERRAGAGSRRAESWFQGAG